jgi:hypothetical protein
MHSQDRGSLPAANQRVDKSVCIAAFGLVSAEWQFEDRVCRNVVPLVEIGGPAKSVHVEGVLKNRTALTAATLDPK